MILSLTGSLFPEYQSRLFDLSFPALTGELALMLWLVIKGARPQPLDTATTTAAPLRAAVGPK